MPRKTLTAEQLTALKHRLLMEMSHHVGEANAIGMGELYETVVEKSYNHRINDTRLIRRLITGLQDAGVPIVSGATGYWLASAGSELTDYCDKLKSSALKKLAKVAMLKKTALPDLLGQMQIEYTETLEGH